MSLKTAKITAIKTSNQASSETRDSESSCLIRLERGGDGNEGRRSGSGLG